MKNIESLISPLVKAHFPSFYEEEGARFIDFVKQYYQWMESTNQAIGASRNLFDYRDIDKTSDEFVKYFKEKYLKGIPLTTVADTRRLVKHSTDLYDAKGTSRGVELVIQGLYDQESTVYFPGQDILRTSDGTWIKPVYLELSVQDRTKTYIGKEIVGNISGAKAFVESVVRRRIGQRYQEVAYLSGVRGDFQTGEFITTSANTVLLGAPLVVGSMTTLDVITGGAEFAVGDVFDVISSKGKQGKARVTGVSDLTGAVYFEFINALVSGGWGYTTTSQVLISDKVLVLDSKTNANTEYTDFIQFETVAQVLANVGYTMASGNNSNFNVGTVVENYYGNGTVAANAVIVRTTKTTNSSGYIIVAPNVGQINMDSTFALSGNSASASITAFADRTVTANLIATNSTAVGVITVVGGNFFTSPYANLVGLYTNTTGTITQISTGGDADFDVGRITETETALLAPDFLRSRNTGNVVFVTNATSGILLNAFNSNAVQYGTDVTFNANADVSGVTDYIAISSASDYANDAPVRYYVDTGNTALVGLTSNTVYYVEDANNTHISLKATPTGSKIELTKGLTQTGHHLVGPLRTLSTDDVQYRGIGFVKFPSASLDATILDCLRLESKTIGAIASIKNINPGSDYNIDPFVVVLEESVWGYNRHDYTMTVTPVLGTFLVGERIEQTFTEPAVQLTYTGFSGTDAQGVTTTAPVVGELVFQANATHAQAASGIVVEFGGGALKLKTVGGTFTITSVSTYPLQTYSTGATANITNINTGLTYDTTARGLVKEIVDNEHLLIKRISLEQTFTNGGLIIGRSSGAQATIDEVGEDFSVPAIGINANIGANVQTANNVVTDLQVVDSGYGYEEAETVTLIKEDSIYEVTAQVHLGRQGIGEGYYSTMRGFLDADKKLRDGEYYQEYSYEVQTKIPFDDYVDVLKQITHVAGTRAFGRVMATNFANVEITSPDPLVQVFQLTVDAGLGTYTIGEEVTQVTNTDINASGEASGLIADFVTTMLLANTTHAPYITQNTQISQPTYVANTYSANVIGVELYSNTHTRVAMAPTKGTIAAGSLQANIGGNTFTINTVLNANTITGSFANNEIVYQAPSRTGTRSATGVVLPGSANTTSVTVVGIQGTWYTGLPVFGTSASNTSANLVSKAAFSSAYTFTATSVINTMDITDANGIFTVSTGVNGRVIGASSNASSNVQYVTINLNT